jgi:c-di-GMP-binding flagellar brake protein YcgR
MTDRPNTRRYPRLAAQHAVLVRRAAPEAEESFAPTRSLSFGGCSFLSPEAFGPGAVVDLLISVQDRVVDAAARVVYENPGADGRNEIGVEFLRIEPADREFLRSLFDSDLGDV